MPADWVLVGAFQHTKWLTRELTAKCDKVDYRYDYTPEQQCAEHLTENNYNAYLDQCHCGIYVVKSPDQIVDYQRWPAIVAVSAWGNYIEFEKGYRVQHVRMEHIWIEPSWFEETALADLDVDDMLQRMRIRYGVEVEVRKSAVCCGQDHPMAYWPSQRGPILICKMATEHIVNCLRYMKKARSYSEHKWKFIFEQELERRKPQIIGGKTLVTF